MSNNISKQDKAKLATLLAVLELCSGALQDELELMGLNTVDSAKSLTRIHIELEWFRREFLEES